MKKSSKGFIKSLKPKKRREDMTNFEKIESTDAYNTAKHRDVYGTQQLDRGELRKVEGPRSRIILNIIISIFIFTFTWFLLSMLDMGLSAFNDFIGRSNPMSSISSQGSNSNSSNSNTSISSSHLPDNYWVKSSTTDKKTLDQIDVYYQVDEQGRIVDPNKEYRSAGEVPMPDWWIRAHGRETKLDVNTSLSPSESKSSNQANKVSENQNDRNVNYAREKSDSMLDAILTFKFWKFLISSIVSLIFFAFFHQVLMRNLDAQNAGSTTDDINQYKNDSHVALPEEIQRQFDYFPDVGAHSSVQVSSMISHVMLSNKGIKNVMVARRAEGDIFDEDGDIIYHKGEELRDDEGNILTKSLPLFDTKFGDDLFEASGALDDKRVRKFYDTTKIPYNIGNKNRDKLKGYNTVADLINGDWSFPLYEVQRPAGVYLVDTAPVNTLVVAMTRVK